MDDAKLLDGSIPLKQKGLEALVDRYADNMTMLRLICEYSLRHSVYMDRAIYTEEMRRKRRFTGQGTQTLNRGKVGARCSGLQDRARRRCKGMRSPPSINGREGISICRSSMHEKCRG